MTEVGSEMTYVNLKSVMLSIIIQYTQVLYFHKYSNTYENITCLFDEFKTLLINLKN